MESHPSRTASVWRSMCTGFEISGWIASCPFTVVVELSTCIIENDHIAIYSIGNLDHEEIQIKSWACCGDIANLEVECMISFTKFAGSVDADVGDCVIRFNRRNLARRVEREGFTGVERPDRVWETLAERRD
jgi:hypothetical protein